MGMRPCGPLLSRLPAFLDFSFAFQVPAFLYNIFLRSPVLLHFCFAFLCSCVNERMCGVGVQLITHVLYVYGRIRWAGSTCHRATHNPPGHECIVYKYTGGKPVWGQTHILSTIPPFHLSSPPLPHHNCVISSQERKFSFPFLSHSCIKFACPCTRIPKIPEMRERGNTKPGTFSHLWHTGYIKKA